MQYMEAMYLSVAIKNLIETLSNHGRSAAVLIHDFGNQFRCYFHGLCLPENCWPQISQVENESIPPDGSGWNVELSCPHEFLVNCNSSLITLASARYLFSNLASFSAMVSQ